jgi:hypothetical protein
LAKITGQQLTFLDYFGYDNRMARPRKKPEDRKDYHLRVPLTDGQHALIEEAVNLADQDKAAWARAVLLDAARKHIAKAKKAGPTP